MSSRALSLATVLLLIGFGATDAVLAQATNLEAGKAPSQLFAQTCNACHKSPRGLLKTVAPGSLPGFLRQHYTTSSDMAGVLASYLVSNGATDTRYQAKDGKDKKDGAKDKEAATNPAQSPEHQGRRQRSQEAAKPEGEGAAQPAEGRQKRAARPAEEGLKPEGQPAPEGRKGKRRAKPGTEEAPKLDAAAPATVDKKSEPKAESKPETAKVDSGEAKSDSRPSEKPAESKPDTAKVEPRGSDAPELRPDPVPQVTPAPPKVEETSPKPAAPAASSEPAARPQEPAPATAAAPAPAESSGPPTPPISR
ncbi:hypothetical protein A5906_02980 [Bradyrhizobium sacchari]|uniref:Cytochrome c domain-containing protein n=1 Tax=Bradyrhizobium sacchari TaxID=1399419 RepID=A0A560KM55_9BRAD|nr:hypothetical protein [Bradyrhizobium sacchari]OPY96593.1 hypothetical protein A5906_02980 [Bradyrhizobium sacchari]TWB66975.1 hypothetical protein FBZ94_101655 [Bradyrhizobium sacchari]TWB84212.1 hypothetical protein FBZ95_101655 [Bradyrhizobium sacchari]